MGARRKKSPVERVQGEALDKSVPFDGRPPLFLFPSIPVLIGWVARDGSWPSARKGEGEDGVEGEGKSATRLSDQPGSSYPVSIV